MDIDRPIPGWAPSTPAVPGGSIDELARQHPAIAIHFWAAWNGSDPPMDRSIQEIVGQFAGRVLFVSCDTDREENHELCRRFGLAAIPALGILVSGRRPELIIGRRDPDHLASEIEGRLNQSARKRGWLSWR